ncbi:hypothetical protein DN824_21645 [Stutzerimonas nosocomialis]|uniref:hypothetical protein n=1 Tax=Stutzerimonas nosocomialis TaxID=1056496 RepID=UPI001107E9F3|nr:hypothetical protein [Stutzerimonas nosocomialis]TLX53820.1 hypothetical protein DN824_21645 [Stutzerimonas nosocomialis]
MKSRRTVFEHNGYKLRSYTELMWARLMDAIDVFYLYEPDLIQVEGCKYLPDFYLPAADFYLEVKGTYPTPEEKAKAEQAHKATGCPVVFLISRPESDKNGFMNCCIQAPGAKGWIDISLHDLDQMYRVVAGEIPWIKALISVREDDYDWVRPIGEIMDEVLLEMAGRSSMESHLRLVHKRVNEERSSVERTTSIAEQGLTWWRNRYFPRGNDYIRIDAAGQKHRALGATR